MQAGAQKRGLRAVTHASRKVNANNKKRGGDGEVFPSTEALLKRDWSAAARTSCSRGWRLPNRSAAKQGWLEARPGRAAARRPSRSRVGSATRLLSVGDGSRTLKVDVTNVRFVGKKINFTCIAIAKVRVFDIWNVSLYPRLLYSGLNKVVLRQGLWQLVTATLSAPTAGGGIKRN